MLLQREVGLSEDADLSAIADRAASALLGDPSSGHQDREVGLVQDSACDAPNINSSGGASVDLMSDEE